MITYSCKHTSSWCPGSDIQTRELCYDCRHKLIGQTIHFLRFGDLPKNGQSYNCRDNRHEDGISCYMIIDGELKNNIRPEFRGRTKIIYGTAILIGFGGDDEAIIESSTIIRLRIPKKIKAAIMPK